MSLDDAKEPGEGGDSTLAAEYVLGVLPSDERRAVASRLETDQSFLRLIEGWEAYFSPLAKDFTEVEVPAAVKVAIDRRLFATGAGALAKQPPPARSLWASLALWRAVAVASLAALVLYVTVPLLSPVAPPQPMLVASLAPNDSDISYLAVYDGNTGTVGLSRLSGEAPQGRDFELWVIEGTQAPVSLGVIPHGAESRMPVGEALRDGIVSGAVFAVSDEPPGGSPTGQPTGPVVAAGDLKAI